MRTLCLVAVLPFAAPAAPTTLVGVLSEQADRLCTDSGDQWVNKRLEVGFVELVGEVAGAKDLLGQPVVVTGAAVAPPDRAPVRHTAECEVMQMRSDWQVGFNGVRIRRTAPQAVKAFRVGEVKALEGFTGAKEGEDVVVTFSNKTGAALDEVVVEFHYEGCYGKPDSVTERRRGPASKPNSTATARAPLMVTRRRRNQDRAHALRAVTVAAKGDHAVFDLTVDALELGVAVECPKARRGP